MTRPNCIVLSVGHSGSTPVARMLNLLGWQFPGEDSDEMTPSGFEQFHYWRRMEPEFSVRLNDKLLKHLNGNEECDVAAVVEEMREVYLAAPQPWVIKDPRFVVTLDLIQEMILEECPETVLLWNVKDQALVEASYKRRSEHVERNGQKVPGFYGHSVAELYELAQEKFDGWPGRKARVDWGDIKVIVRVLRDAHCMLSSLDRLRLICGEGIQVRKLAERFGITRKQLAAAVEIFEMDRDQRGHKNAGSSSWKNWRS